MRGGSGSGGSCGGGCRGESARSSSASRRVGEPSSSSAQSDSTQLSGDERTIPAPTPSIGPQPTTSGFHNEALTRVYQRENRSLMIDYNYQKIADAQAQIQTQDDEFIAESGDDEEEGAEDEELARMMAVHCLADELLSLEINDTTFRPIDLGASALDEDTDASQTSGPDPLAMLQELFSSTTKSTANSSSSTNETGKENEVLTPVLTTPFPLGREASLRAAYPEHFQMCEYYIAAASYAELLHRSNQTVKSHSSLLSRIRKTREKEQHVTLKQQARLAREQAQTRLKSIQEREERDHQVFRRGHDVVWKRGVLQAVNREAWGLERAAKREREREEMMRRVREQVRCESGVAIRLAEKRGKRLARETSAREKLAMWERRWVEGHRGDDEGEGEGGW